MAIMLGAPLAACGPKRAPLPYEHAATRPNPGGDVVACAPMVDRRAARDIDERIEGDTLAALDGVFRAEVEASGVAREVRALPGPILPSNGELRAQGVDLLVEPTLEELAWQVPDYDGIWTTTMVVSIFTGGIGGLVYGSTPTDVLGKAVLTVRLTDLRSGRTSTARYVGDAQARMAKLSSDSSSARREMVSQALSSAMEQFRTDLARFADGAVATEGGGQTPG